MKVGLALGFAAALVMVPIGAVLLGCQAGCNQPAFSEGIELQPAWVSCGISLDCLR
jgi:hypothetical protein